MIASGGSCAVHSSDGDVGIYPYAVLGVLIAASMLSFVDRTILGLLVDPLKQQFGFDEPEIGLLAGFGFVLFFSIMGLPFGRLLVGVSPPRRAGSHRVSRLYFSHGPSLASGKQRSDRPHFPYWPAIFRAPDSASQ
jgi:hypothetical protein